MGTKPRPIDMPKDPHDIGMSWGKYKGEVYIVGSGTSLYKFNYKKLKGKKTIALNDAVKRFTPTWHLYSDCNLYKRYTSIDYSKTFPVCQEKIMKNYKESSGFKYKSQVRKFVHTSRAEDCTDKDNKIFVQSTVATGAIMLAAKLGFTKIFLLGIDGYCFEKMYYADGTTKNGRVRGQKKDKDGKIVQNRHEKWQKQMRELETWLGKYYHFDYDLKNGSGVFNLNKKSTIDAWPYVEDFLKEKELPVKLTNKQYEGIYNPLYAELNYGKGGNRKIRINEVLNSLAKRKVEKGAKVLVISCGRGAMVDSLIDAGYDVQGTEICDYLLKNDLKNKPVKKLFCSELYTIPDNSFDVVVCCEILEHLSTEEEVEQTITDISRIASRYLMVTFSKGKAVKRGITLHNIQQDEEWWFSKFRKICEVEDSVCLKEKKKAKMWFVVGKTKE